MSSACEQVVSRKGPVRTEKIVLQFRAAIIFVCNESYLTRDQVWIVMNDNNSKILPEAGCGGFLRRCLTAKRHVLRMDVPGRIPAFPPHPAVARAHAIVSTIAKLGLIARALPPIPTALARSGSFNNAVPRPRRHIAFRERSLPQNVVPSNESSRMDLTVSREAGVMRIPLRGALSQLISLLSLLLLVGCCQFFRGSDDVVSFTISPLNMSIQPGSTQKFSAIGTFGLGGTGDITSRVKWTSSNPARVTIDSTGLATAVAYGTVTISGSYECYVAQTSVSVVNQTAAGSSIAVLHKLRGSRAISHSICLDSNLLE
jgi:Bacterial Ig-like domain (group 2)